MFINTVVRLQAFWLFAVFLSHFVVLIVVVFWDEYMDEVSGELFSRFLSFFTSLIEYYENT